LTMIGEINLNSIFLHLCVQNMIAWITLLFMSNWLCFHLRNDDCT
jgi:hypothetical protein